MPKVFWFRDFVPQMTQDPGILRMAEYEDFEEAVVEANQWVRQNRIHVLQIETVVLPNIWSPYEEGTTDSSLGTRGGAPSHWHQFVRVWFETDEEVVAAARQATHDAIHGRPVHDAGDEGADHTTDPPGEPSAGPDQTATGDEE
ncbi:MAG: hypothetical protein QGG36_28535 [Pirellulaceae bacterium]|jgi:hypothetical protein|nr:hypothetical protein [Pirellulaceae bacterium]MDP7019779.1 hypothetical protein [Pirellulaceae bacterium]